MTWLRSVNKVIPGAPASDAEVRVATWRAPVASSHRDHENWTSREGARRNRRAAPHRPGARRRISQPYLVKGKQIYLKPPADAAVGERGQKHYTNEAKADKIVLLGGGRGGGDRQVDQKSDGAGYQIRCVSCSCHRRRYPPSSYVPLHHIDPRDGPRRPFPGVAFQTSVSSDRGHAMDRRRLRMASLVHLLPTSCRRFLLEQDLPDHTKIVRPSSCGTAG